MNIDQASGTFMDHVSPTVQSERTSKEALPRPATGRWGGYFVWFLVYLGLVLGLQWRTGAYFDDFSATSDEPGHFSNALVVHDYLLGGFPDPPIPFLYKMYARYPKIAMGHWPPAFYLVMALWMLLFGATRTAVLALIAVCAAGMAVVIRGMIVKHTTPAAANVSPLFALLLPASSMYVASVMMEVPLALFATLSAAALVKFLEKDNWFWAILTGLFLSLAICTKGNALALLPAYVAAVYMAAGWKRLFQIRSIVVGLIVSAICAPVYLLSLKVITRWPGESAGLEFASLAIHTYVSQVWSQFGPVLLGVILVGVVLVCLKGRERVMPIWAVASTWIVFTFIFHLAVPMAIEFRYLVAAAPAVCWFAAAGIAELTRRWTFIPVMAILCVFTLNAAGTPRIARGGMSSAIKHVLDLGGPETNRAVFVASSSASGEGRAIVEGFQRDRQHRFVFLRATKYISDSDWMGKRYEMQLHTPEEVQRQLETLPASFVVLHRESSVTSPEQELIERVVRKYADQWAHVFHRLLPVSDDGSETIDIYHNTRLSRVPIGPVLVNLKESVGEVVHIDMR